MGQHQICAFGKYENGFPLLCRDDACKEWQEVSAKSAQTDDVKGDVRSLGSQDILSNGNGRGYLQKKEEGGGRNKGNIQKGSSLQLVKCKNLQLPCAE